jgi:hypothetical protein
MEPSKLILMSVTSLAAAGVITIMDIGRYCTANNLMLAGGGLVIGGMAYLVFKKR